MHPGLVLPDHNAEARLCLHLVRHYKYRHNILYHVAPEHAGRGGHWPCLRRVAAHLPQGQGQADKYCPAGRRGDMYSRRRGEAGQAHRVYKFYNRKPQRRRQQGGAVEEGDRRLFRGARLRRRILLSQGSGCGLCRAGYNSQDVSQYDTADARRVRNSGANRIPFHRGQTVISFVKNINRERIYVAFTGGILLFVSLFDNHMFYLFPTLLYVGLIGLLKASEEEGERRECKVVQRHIELKINIPP